MTIPHLRRLKYKRRLTVSHGKTCGLGGSALASASQQRQRDSDSSPPSALPSSQDGRQSAGHRNRIPRQEGQGSRGLSAGSALALSLWGRTPIQKPPGGLPPTPPWRQPYARLRTKELRPNQGCISTKMGRRCLGGHLLGWTQGRGIPKGRGENGPFYSFLAKSKSHLLGGAR